jgi:predicted phage tail protein
MQEIEKKKEINDKIKADEFEKLKKRRLNNIERTRENLQAIAEDDEAFRLDILEYQTMILNRGVTKDNVTNMKRLNANDKTIINQMNIEKNLKNFRKKMFQLKDQSIIAKSQEEKYAMYKEKKRQEAEKKKKEMEDKLNKI